MLSIVIRKRYCTGETMVLLSNCTRNIQIREQKKRVHQTPGHGENAKPSCMLDFPSPFSVGVMNDEYTTLGNLVEMITAVDE